MKSLTLLLLLIVSAHAEVRVQISSQFLARGERAILELRIEGREPDSMPSIPSARNLVIEPLGFGRPRMLPGRRLEASFEYAISSYEIGQHTIPPIEVIVDGQRFLTDPTFVEIFDPNDLNWSEAKASADNSNRSLRYASTIRVRSGKIFENQTVEAEIKVYVPTAIAQSLRDAGVPEFERSGLAAWRFEPSERFNEVNLLGQPYVGLSYPSTMTAMKSGDVTIGPATVRLTYVEMIFDRFTQRTQVQATLDVPQKVISRHSPPSGCACWVFECSRAIYTRHCNAKD